MSTILRKPSYCPQSSLSSVNCNRLLAHSNNLIELINYGILGFDKLYRHKSKDSKLIMCYVSFLMRIPLQGDE